MLQTFCRSGGLRGQLRPPSDKSLTHRSFMFAAMARGESCVRQPLLGEDCRATLDCLAAMGLGYEISGGTVRLNPPNELAQPKVDLDCGNSGTTMRLLAGIVAARPLDVCMFGDESLSRRPMRRIAEPLRQMGATVDGDTPPLRIRGGNLRAIDYQSPVASAQIKSCVLLAGLRADGTTWVTEPAPSRDHTERMLSALGVPLIRDGVSKVGVESGSTWDGFEFCVPADISSAAFWMVGAAIVPGSEVRLSHVGLNPTRTGILDVFESASISVKIENLADEMGEPVGDLCVAKRDGPKAFEISGALVPRLVDEIPVLAVLATQCDGQTTIRDAAELKVKESDRIQLVADGLKAMGASVEPTPDGMIINGPTPLKGTTIHAHGDHRIAMAFAVAGMVADGETAIDGFESVQTSYPHFMQHYQQLNHE